MAGYSGKILYIDLTSGKIEKEPLDLKFARKYIGGVGFGAKIYLDLIKDKPDFDALSIDNPFVIMTGPLTGMNMQSVARWTVCAKSPLTGFWGDANIGGFFGAELKFAGYDGIVITGGSEKPKYIFIEDEKVEIREADDYWGEDVYTVNDRIIEANKGESRKKGQVFAIGPAGENLVSFASIINKKGHAAGRTGMGAVWGSKKLKAIFVRGSGKLKVAYPGKLTNLRKELKELYDENITITALKEFGTQSHIDVGVMIGDVPMKNWQINDWENIDEIGPMSYGDKIGVKNATCYGCGVACKRVAELKKGKFQFNKGPGPEYETVCTFGSMCLNDNIESVGKANEICNRYGMDTITCGSTIAFAIECFENGLIDEKDTDGLKLTWGNAEAIVSMTEKIGKKEGFGATLSKGSAKAAEHIGGNAKDFLSTVKGLEAPMHDPRSFHGFGLAYGVSPRGACHMASLEFPIEGGGMFLPEFPELKDDIIGMTSQGKAKLNIISQDFGSFFSHCAVFCNLGSMILNATQALDMINHVTGFDYSLDEIIWLGKRIWYLRRGLTNLFGARVADDQLPKRLLSPIDTSSIENSAPDMDLMLKEFYKLREFDSKGIPKKEILGKLELSELIELLYRDN